MSLTKVKTIAARAISWPAVVHARTRALRQARRSMLSESLLPLVMTRAQSSQWDLSQRGA